MDDRTLEVLAHGFEVKGLYAAGLTDAEISLAEETWQIRFPLDLRRLLQFVLPSGAAFPNWRDPDEELARQLGAPIDGVLFDVRQNSYWCPGWGERPETIEDAVSRASEELRSVPPLIPVYGHRYVPQEPHLAGNPILSVVQTDIILYGSDLEDYICREFSLRAPHFSPTAPRDLILTRHIPFWGDLVT
jgi:hypothetical protein